MLQRQGSIRLWSGAHTRRRWWRSANTGGTVVAGCGPRGRRRTASRLNYRRGCHPHGDVPRLLIHRLQYYLIRLDTLNNRQPVRGVVSGLNDLRSAIGLKYRVHSVSQQNPCHSTRRLLDLRLWRIPTAAPAAVRKHLLERKVPNRRRHTNLLRRLVADRLERIRTPSLHRLHRRNLHRTRGSCPGRRSRTAACRRSLSSRTRLTNGRTARRASRTRRSTARISPGLSRLRSVSSRRHWLRLCGGIHRRSRLPYAKKPDAEAHDGNDPNENPYDNRLVFLIVKPFHSS